MIAVSMDVLCFHPVESVTRRIVEVLKDIGMEAANATSVQSLRMMIEKEKPAVVLVPDSSFWEVEEGDFLKLALSEVSGEAKISVPTEDVTQFLHDFVRSLIENSENSRVRELLEREEMRKNVIYAYGFSWGKSYVVKTSLQRNLYEIIPIFSKKELPIFIAMREKPDRFAGLPNAKVVWVTDIVGKDRIKPHNLTILTDSIIRFIEEHGNAIVVMDCVEYLLLYNEFVNILRNIELINSYVMEHKSILIIIIDSNAYTTKEYSLLSRYALEWNGA